MKFIQHALLVAALAYLIVAQAHCQQEPKITRTEDGGFDAEVSFMLNPSPSAVFAKEHVHLAATNFALRLLEEDGRLPYISGVGKGDDEIDTQYECYIMGRGVTVVVYWYKQDASSKILPSGKVLISAESEVSEAEAKRRLSNVQILFVHQIQAIKTLFAQGKKAFAAKLTE